MSYAKDFFDKYYDVLYDKDVDSNPFCTTETRKVYDYFNDYYIHPIWQKDHSKGEEMASALGDIVHTLNRNAFEVGFRLAFQLLSDLYSSDPTGKQQ